MKIAISVGHGEKIRGASATGHDPPGLDDPGCQLEGDNKMAQLDRRRRRMDKLFCAPECLHLD